VLNTQDISSVLLTGGGAFNDFLIERIRAKTSVEIVIPSDQIVEMKEAVIFAFLGVLRLLNRTNIISENTGASHPSISGALYNGQV
jgi:anhydro-N-acetylmuramic acid kinase